MRIIVRDIPKQIALVLVEGKTVDRVWFLTGTDIESAMTIAQSHSEVGDNTEIRYGRIVYDKKPLREAQIEYESRREGGIGWTEP